MKRINIPEAKLRELVRRMPFNKIAEMFGCEARTITARVQELGLIPTFGRRPATEDEISRIAEMVAKGFSTKHMARVLGRSQDFVSRRAAAFKRGESPRALGGPARRPSYEEGEWPRRSTNAAEAIGGRRFDDVRPDVLAREWPPHRPPVNGAALARAAQVRGASSSQSTAAWCVES